MIEARGERGGVWLKVKKKKKKKRKEESALVMPFSMAYTEYLKLKPLFAVFVIDTASHIDTLTTVRPPSPYGPLWHCRNCVKSSSCHTGTFERSS